MSNYATIITDPVADFTTLVRALADRSRVRALLALSRGELCVCQLVELLDLAPSTVSRHMAVLGRSHLVRSRKDGRWVYYRRAGADAPPAAKAALEWVDRTLADTPDAVVDAEKLDRILACPVEELCRRSTPPSSA